MEFEAYKYPVMGTVTYEGTCPRPTNCLWYRCLRNHGERDNCAERAQALPRSFDQCYDLGLDSLTDKMYQEAPYDVQRTYRRLDNDWRSQPTMGR